MGDQSGHAGQLDVQWHYPCPVCNVWLSGRDGLLRQLVLAVFASEIARSHSPAEIPPGEKWDMEIKSPCKTQFLLPFHGCVINKYNGYVDLYQPIYRHIAAESWQTFNVSVNVNVNSRFV